MPAAEAEALLAAGRMELLGLLPGASNYTFLARVSDGDRSTLAVYKPRDGESPLWDFPDGTLCQREVAAFVLASALGWPHVPPTVLRDGPHGPGAVQLFVKADYQEHYFTLRDRRLSDFVPTAAFDVVANNADRKAGHCLLAPDGTIWLIDHGVCFAAEPKLRTVIWDFAGEPVPPDIVADLDRVAGELRDGSLRGRLLELLTSAEIDATARRAEELSRSGCFPAPTGNRPYPWPPV
ncbi:MAG TPA: SCO1664 family protein [Actinomycetota bacterium]|nr:SCO1664 family protein [Actinomycetota bacterium]